MVIKVKKMLVCNQKMFLTPDESKKMSELLMDVDYGNLDLIVCPSNINFNYYLDKYNVGAQDCFYENSGAYTGEVSAYHLNLIGVKYVIIGHHERRKYDDFKVINEKVKSAVENSLTPIICLGESKLDKELHRQSEVIKKQLITALKDVTLDFDQEIIIAYEPAFAIGGNQVLDLTDIEDTFEYIKKILQLTNVTSYKLLYGGSVTSDNIKDILSDKIDGYLLGGSSKNISEIKEIINCINNVK